MSVFYRKRKRKHNEQCQETVCTVRLSDMTVNISSSAQVCLKGLLVKGMTKNLKSTSVRVRPVPGATVKPHYYVIPTLTDDTSDTIII